jgi:excisionase family DNA binding protein
MTKALVLSGSALSGENQGSVVGISTSPHIPWQSVPSPFEEFLPVSMILTSGEVAEALRIVERTVREWAATGQLKAYRIGKLWRFLRKDIVLYLREQQAKEQGLL